jgi:hypothetical protein
MRALQPAFIFLNFIYSLKSYFFCISACRLTSADQISVPISIIYSAYTWPEFILFHIFQWKSGLLAAVSMAPFICRNYKLSALSALPSSIAFISARMLSIASQKRSSSALSSLSVGSIIIVPATGKLNVGAWKL